MPIFPSRACAFVHIPKTAGSSVLRALENLDGPIEYAGVGLWGCIAESAEPARVVQRLRENFPISAVRDFPQQHVPASLLRSLAGETRWSGLFSFAFVRNPWDMLVSTYHFARKHVEENAPLGIDPDRTELIRRCATFERFVEMYPAMRSDMTAMLADERGTPIVDFIGRYESLEKDFALICERIGLSAKLPHERASEHAAYQTYYDDRTRRLVAHHFARDIERFGYAF